MSSSKEDPYTCTLSPETLEKAKKELREDPDTRLLEVKTLKTRLEKLPGLKPRTDTRFLLAFLRARKFDQERAFALVKNHYQVKSNNDWFIGLKPTMVQVFLEQGYLEILPDRNRDGCKVMVLRVGALEPDRYPVMEALKCMYLALIDISKDEETQVHGLQMIVDFKNSTWSHFTAFTPSVAKFCFSLIQDNVPLRLRRLDYTHEPSFWDHFWVILKPVIPKKVLERIYLHGNKFDKLYEYIQKEHLPTDLGGTQPPHNDQEWREHFLSTDAEHEANSKFGFVNMAVKQKDKSRSEDAEMQGLGGSFKKLDI